MRFRTHFRIRYVVNIVEIDSTYLDNASRLDDIRRFLHSLSADSLMQITDVRFAGTASPEGPYEWNIWLSENRLRTFREYVHQHIDLPDSLIRAQDSDIAWRGFRQMVADSDLPWRDEILSVTDQTPTLQPWYYDARGNLRHIDSRLVQLRRMHGGQVWRAIKNPILRDLRYGDVTIELRRRWPALPRLAVADPQLPELQIVELPPPIGPRWIPNTYLKTNLLGLALLMASVGVEWDLRPHLSLAVPLYFSGGLDYFKSTVKFRNFIAQPELRWWPRLRGDGHGLYHNDGFFVGAHAELAYYNFAFDGRYRYQDHRGRTPALGGGLSLGWRRPFGREQRWSLECALGVGVYPVDYDLFDNTPNYLDGQLMGRRQETYVGIDEVAVTLGYSFGRPKRIRPLTLKGGVRR